MSTQAKPVYANFSVYKGKAALSLRVHSASALVSVASPNSISREWEACRGWRSLKQSRLPPCDHDNTRLRWWSITSGLYLQHSYQWVVVWLVVT